MHSRQTGRSGRSFVASVAGCRVFASWDVGNFLIHRQRIFAKMAYTFVVHFSYGAGLLYSIASKNSLSPCGRRLRRRRYLMKINKNTPFLVSMEISMRKREANTAFECAKFENKCSDSHRHMGHSREDPTCAHIRARDEQRRHAKCVCVCRRERILFPLRKYVTEQQQEDIKTKTL